MSKGSFNISGAGAASRDALASSSADTALDEDTQQRFFDACKAHNLPDAEAILRENQDYKEELANSLIEIDAVNASEGSREVSLLFHAAQLGYVDIVTLLLANDAEFNFAAPDNGATPLLAAAHNGHAEVAEKLLTHGADVDKACLLYTSEADHEG